MPKTGTLSNWFTSLFSSTSPRKRDEDGDYLISYNFFDTTPRFNDYSSDKEKLQAILKSPAVLKVFKLQCDLFSIGKIYVYEGENELPEDIALKMLDNPNPMQSQSQWLWDFMFWNMAGTAYVYLDSDIVKEDNITYLLDPSKMEWPLEFEKMQDKLILSKNTKSNILKQFVKYRYDDGSSIDIPISKIIPITDLSNGLGNWFKGNSSLDALHKVISNSEAALDSENINIRYSGKYMVAGKADPNNTTHLPMGDTEKKDIESKMNGPKHVHAVKSMIDIKRFVENIDNLKLPEAYMNAYYIIGSMFNIPRDVLEAYNEKGSTYENQEKSTAKHISYCLEPKANDLMDAISKRIGYADAGKNLVMSWDHLPFMQVMEADRQKVKKQQADTFCLLVDQGVPFEEVNQFLDTTFSKAEKNAKPTTTIASNN